MSKRSKSANPLWTRDFTILTIGSMVSLFGNAVAGFSLSLLVLDYTNNSLLYAIFIAAYTAPQIIMPVFSGAILDRFSRKKMIYTLDFISAGLYFSAAWLLSSGWFSFPVFAVGCFFIGSVNSIYMVAFESFYPLLISEGNYSKAYSISSVLETMSVLMMPLSSLIYNRLGIAPLMGLNSACFLLAAAMETQIYTEEKYIGIRKAEQNAVPEESGKTPKWFWNDIREGFRYLISEKGLFAIAVYFTFSALVGGSDSVISLPYFKSNYENGENIYILVWGMSYIGRAIGGGLHYRFEIPAKWKYAIAFVVYLCVNTFQGLYLFCGIPVMMVLCFLIGVLGVTSYTIRLSGTQAYVPDEKKGRFSGAFNMLTTVGTLCGELLSGALMRVLPARIVMATFCLIALAADFVFIGGWRQPVSQIYNADI